MYAGRPFSGDLIWLLKYTVAHNIAFTKPGRLAWRGAAREGPAYFGGETSTTAKSESTGLVASHCPTVGLAGWPNIGHVAAAML